MEYELATTTLEFAEVTSPRDDREASSFGLHHHHNYDEEREDEEYGREKRHRRYKI